MAGIRVGLDGDALTRPLSGVGQYVFQVARALADLIPDASLYLYTRRDKARLAIPSDRWVVRQEPSPAFRRLPSFLWLKTRGRAMCEADRIDAFWACRSLSPGLSRNVRTVCTVHDLNIFMVPETMELPTRWSHRLWFARDVRKADVVLCNSKGTASRLLETLGVRSHGLMYPGLSDEFRPLEHSQEVAQELETLGVRAPYILCVSTLEPRKNLHSLLEAFVRLKDEHRLADYQLVIVGAKGWRNDRLFDALSEAKARGVVVTGYVTDDLMPKLFASAELLVVPSRYEGFGMPALEARACGTRLLVTDLPELREAGGAHAVVVEPTVDGLAAGIPLALAGPRHVEPGLAESYSWKASAAVLARMVDPMLRPE